MDDVVFKLTTVYDGASLAQGMAQSSSVVESNTAEWIAAFTASSQEILDRLRAIDNGIRYTSQTVATIPAATRAAAVETEGVLSLLEAKFVETAETAKLSAAGVGSAFSGLSALLGGGLLIGFFAHFLDETNKEVLELGHLSEKTGIAISSLGGLQIATREMGVNFESVQTAMVRLERAQALAVEGGKAQEAAFRRIGLSIKDIQGLSPEELFNAVSGAIHDTGSSSDAAASAIALLGRGGAALIPIFKQYGDNIGEASRKLGEQSGITEEAYQNSLKWQKVTADLSAELRKLGIEVLGPLTSFIQYFNDGLAYLTTGIENEIIVVKEFVSDMHILSEAIKDGTNPDAWVSAFGKIEAGAINSTAAILKNTAAVIARVEAGHAPKLDDESGRDVPSGGGGPKTERMEEWKLQLQQMEDAANDSHVVMLSRELAFWDSILQTVKLSTKEEIEVRHSIASLNKQVMAEIQGDVLRGYDEAAKAAGAGSQEEIAVLQTKYQYAAATYGEISAQAVHAYEQLEAASGKAALKEIADFEAVAKAHLKLMQEEMADDQKQLEAQRKQQTARIEQQTKQKVEGAGGGKGVLGPIVEVNAAREQTVALLALNQAYESQSIAIARASADEKIQELNAVRAAYEADAKLNTQNAQADAEKIKQIDRELTTAKAEEERKEVDIVRAAKNEEASIEAQSAKMQQEKENQLSNNIAAEMDKMILHTRNFQQAFVTLWRDMATQAIQHMVRIGAQFIAHEIMMTAAHTASQTAQTAASAAGASARSGIGAVEDFKSIGRAAATAAAHAFKWVMEEVPFPANIVLAPAAAAAAFTGVMAFGALAEKGYDVPGGSGVYPTILHPREMVLPADLAGGVRNMVKTNSTQSSSSSTINARFQFSPVINGNFDVSKHGDELYSFFRGKLMRMGVPV